MIIIFLLNVLTFQNVLFKIQYHITPILTYIILLTLYKFFQNDFA